MKHKYLEDPPAFWTNSSKLNKLTYHPKKCAIFLEISGITDPNWSDNGATIQLDYWISLATQWFIDHEEYDENGNRTQETGLIAEILDEEFLG